MQSFFIGTGAIIASALPWVMTNWFNISNTAPEGQIPPSVKFAFYIGGIVFFLAVLWTVARTKEYSPEELEEFSKAEAEDKPEGIGATYDETLIRARRLFMQGSIWLFISLALFFIFYFFVYMDYGLGVFFGGAAVFGLLQILTGAMTAGGMVRNGFVEVINDLYKMPRTMKQLAIVQFFSWFALFSMWIYTTAGVTATKYDMKLDRGHFDLLQSAVNGASVIPEAAEWETLEGVRNDLEEMAIKYAESENVVTTMRIVKFFTDEKKNALLGIPAEVTDRLEYIKEEYNDGADWVGVLMAVYNGFAAVMAFVLMWMASVTSRKRVHAISLLIGGVSLASFYFIANPTMLIIPELGIGLAWASILAMPYAILTGSLPSHKMGTYMGIFNFFIVIPQITAAAILGFFVRELFQNQAIYALVLGGISMVIAALLVLFVDDVDEGK